MQPDGRVADGDEMKPLKFVLTVGLIAAAAAPARLAAQQSQKDSARKSASVPAEARPPKGMCRIWLDNVPANQQPAATDCATAVKNRPANGHVIFGDDFADTTKARGGDKAPALPPNIKGFTGVKTTMPVVVTKRPPE